MKKILFILSTILLLAACSPTRRLDRLVTRHPELLKVDTAYITQPVITETISKDTTITLHTRDTVLIEKEKLKVQLIRLPGEKIRVVGECKSDTIRIQVPVITKKYIDKKLSFADKVRNAKYLLLVIIFLWAATIYYYKQSKFKL